MHIQRRAEDAPHYRPYRPQRQSHLGPASLRSTRPSVRPDTRAKAVMATLTVLHTADLHNRLTEAAARRLQALREEHSALLLDSGDALAVPNILVPIFAPAVLTRMNQAGYAAMALGNREYFFRKRWLIRGMAPADFAVLTANLRAQKADLHPIQPWVILSSPQGDSVGIFGLTPTMIKPGTWWEVFSDMRFVPWREATAKAVKALRPQVQWLVALSHLTLEESLRLAEEFAEIDLVLGGHSHPETAYVEKVGEVTVCCAPPYGQAVVKLQSCQPAVPSQFETESLPL